MIVQAIYEIDVDVSDLDPKYHEAYAKSMAQFEMDCLIWGDPSLEERVPQISCEHFKYIVKEKNT